MKYPKGTFVIAGSLKLRMIVIDAVEQLNGWKYQLAFPKKNGEPHKRRTHRWFMENDIVPEIQ